MILTAVAAGLASGMAIAARAAIPMFLIMIVMVFVLIAFADLATRAVTKALALQR